MTPVRIERASSIAKELGTGADRLRAVLNTKDYPTATLIEATRISPPIIERFQQGGSVTDEQLDMIAGFVRGEYALSGISSKWVRAPFHKPESAPLPMACPDLPVTRTYPHPLGNAAPVVVEQDAMPTLVDPTPMPTLTPQGDNLFGKRGGHE